mgnify:CR=1 FL=1
MNTVHIQLLNKMNLYICESFVKELQEVTEQYENVKIHSYKSKCKYQHIKDPFENVKTSDENSYVLGGCSIEENDLTPSLQMKKENSCFYMFAPKTLVQSYMSDGAYIITPGWLEQWKTYVQEFWGFDEETARHFFNEFCKKLVLLDTLGEEKTLIDLKEFSSFVGKPYEVVAIGLEYFKLYVQNILKEDISKVEKEKNKKKLNDSLQNSANYAMAFDFLSKFNENLDEKDIVNKIIETFVMLFAPGNIKYIIIKDNKVVENISLDHSTSDIQNKFLNIQENYILKNDCFAIKLIYANKVVGIISIEKIAFVEHIDKYLNLALSISELCALAVENARDYLKRKEIEARLTQNAKLISMGEMIGMIAHQWRQPLANIAMSANNILVDIELEMLDEETLRKESLDIINQSKKLSQTIDDFRSFFKPENDKEEILIEDTIKEVLGIIAKLLEENNILLDFNYGTEKKITTYSKELIQVLINIFINAQEALVLNGIENKKISMVIEDSIDGINLKIWDNAGGIKEDILEKIFDPYFSTKSKKDDTGLGLYMSKTIIENHLNGILRAWNLADGVCFEIYLPYNIENIVLNSEVDHDAN